MERVDLRRISRSLQISDIEGFDDAADLVCRESAGSRHEFHPAKIIKDRLI